MPAIRHIDEGASACSYELTLPKIGLYTGGATEPNTPIRPAAGSPYPGHCGVGGNTTYCQALFTLTQEIGLPGSMVLPITTTDLAAAKLVTDGFTAMINPSSTIAAGAGATALQAFVNGGGTYVGQLAGGTTSARNAGLTLLNTQAIAGLVTPGAFFGAKFDIGTPADPGNPVAWGFDAGGFSYRDSSGNPVYDPATLAGDGGAIGPPTAVVSYADPVQGFGYSENADGLAGRPAVVDQPFGAGHAVMLGFDSFFRAWREHDERLIRRSCPSASSARSAGSSPARAVTFVVRRARTASNDHNRSVWVGRIRSQLDRSGCASCSASCSGGRRRRRSCGVSAPDKPNCGPGRLHQLTPDPVFRVSDTATGAPGTACAGMVFNVSLVDPANGQVRFTPQGGAHVTLPGTGAVCRIGFTFSVLRAPGADQNPVQAGTQTVQVSDNTQFAGTLTASARGTLRRLSFPFGQICGATSAVPQRTFSRRVHGVTNAVSAGTRT